MIRRVLSLFVLLFAVSSVDAVDKKKFRTCQQTAFCKRNRDTLTNQEFRLISESVDFDAASQTLTADLQNGLYPQQTPLSLTVSILVNDVARVSIREKKETSLHPRWEVPDILVEDGLVAHKDVQSKVMEDRIEIAYRGDNGKGGNFVRVLKVSLSPFSVSLSIDGENAILLNGEGKLNFEPYRPKNPKPEGADEASKSMYPYDEEGMWGESFHEHSDPMPRGPQSVGIDVAFPGASQVYGIPEHASSFALKNTDGGSGAYSEPYRLFNLDVFEYELDVPMALYGAIPFMISHDKTKTASVLYLNSAETFVDVKDITEATYLGLLKTQQGKASHWMSESGILDMFLSVTKAPATNNIYRNYFALTGFPAMPQRFAIAYHQCRWNYKSEVDVAEVDGGFDEHDIPYDVLWLDIEHTDGKRYFTWDSNVFPNPQQMQNDLAKKGRKMVTIVDPHIKKDSNYYVYADALAKNLFILNDKKETYDGWCWPGSSGYLDFLDPTVRDYWADLFTFDKYQGSTPSLYTWNDMNEPSVFNGPEVTMQKQSLHLGGAVEHRDVHNMYGYYHQRATAEGQLKRYTNKNDRPFVLTRSFFPGSQKYGAVWTGDNAAEWSHLEIATPMLLSLNVAGITFSGADVGGFFGDPDIELLVRWYQSAAFQPFFRGHAHIDTKRREPWLFGEPHTTHIRNAIRRRYSYLPYLYTLFQEAATLGLPIMRPLWSEFPSDEKTFDIGHEFILGSAILVAPVDGPGQTSVDVTFPGESEGGEVTLWMNVENGDTYRGLKTVRVSAPIETIPVFQRGGSIVPKRERARRNSEAMVNDPYTLVIAPSVSMEAVGNLYMDDGKSFDYQKGAYVKRVFTLNAAGLLQSTNAGNQAKEGDLTYVENTYVERVVILGLPSSSMKLSKAFVVETDGSTGRSLEIFTDGRRTIIKKPDVSMMEDWSIQLEF